MNTTYRQIILFLSLSFIFSAVSFAQQPQQTRESNLVGLLPTEFTYQGKLTDNGSTASGNYDFEFKLIDFSGGVIATQQKLNVAVANGIFTVRLDFGSAPFSAAGGARSLEIGVRPVGSAAFTQLQPRQPITASPYAVSSGLALSSQFANQAGDSQMLGGIDANQYVLTGDARLSDARQPLAGSSNYIQNTTFEQPANFNINGTGQAGVLRAYNINSVYQYSLDGAKFITAPGTNNTFLGIGAGANWQTGVNNSFFGSSAGKNNAGANDNSFFGSNSGFQNTTGINNSFFGSSAGLANTTGQGNSFFGTGSGSANVSGAGNSFFGNNSGSVNVASHNSFFGGFAGGSNTTGTQNSFFGYGSGRTNNDGFSNSFFGYQSGFDNVSGNFNSFFGFNAGKANTTGGDNSFFGGGSGAANTTGSNNAFFGRSSGTSNTTGNGNAFFGYMTGFNNTTAGGNSFFGYLSGYENRTGNNNTYIGLAAGNRTTSGSNNTALGYQAGLSTNGTDNTFIGKQAGLSASVGNRNTFIGANAGGANSLGSDNIAIGYNASIQNGVSNSVVIGNSAVATVSDRIILGNSGQNTVVSGRLFISVLGSSGAQPICRVSSTGDIGSCSSSIRYKTDVRNFNSGLDLIRRLRPVTFTWKLDGMRDLGFVAEEVNAVEPLMTTTNEKGEIEGVKYDRVSTALVNAVNEQQTQIETQAAQVKQQQTVIENQERQLKQQQQQIDALKKLVCAQNPNAELCREKETDK